MKTKQKYRLFCMLVLIFFGLILAMGCKQNSSEPGTNTSGDFPMKFHVEGNRIVDENGNELVLRGLIPVDPVTLDYHTETGSDKFLLWEEEIFHRMSEWNANIVRLPIGPYNWRTKGKDKVSEIIDQAIEWASKYGLYVYIDFHGIGFPPTEEYSTQWSATSQDEIIDFWNEISTYYKDNNVVAFYELFNEPTFSGNWPPTKESLESDWLDWKTFVEEVVDTIRANDPESVIIVGGLVWAHDISFVSNEPIARSNIVYAVHPYPATMWYPISWEEAFVVIKNEYPIFVTEFGVGGQTLLKVEDVQDYIRQYIDVEKYEREFERIKDNPDEVKRLYKEFLEEVWSNPYTSSYLNEILTEYKNEIKSLLDEKNIGWSAWIFDFEWGNGLIKDRNYTPTEAGEFYRNWLSEKQ